MDISESSSCLLLLLLLLFKLREEAATDEDESKHSFVCLPNYLYFSLSLPRSLTQR
jgi:hypothetical protein